YSLGLRPIGWSFSVEKKPKRFVCGGLSVFLYRFSDCPLSKPNADATQGTGLRLCRLVLCFCHLDWIGCAMGLSRTETYRDFPRSVPAGVCFPWSFDYTGADARPELGESRSLGP